jgi:hypothetical protein
VERLLPSSQAVYVASVIAAAGGTVPCVGLILVLMKTGFARGGPFEIWIKGIERRSWNLVFLRVFVGVWVILYCLSRIYLMIGGFISLRKLPIGAYSSVKWVDLIPNIT